jgi:RNA polymerase sigma-32 factor
MASSMSIPIAPEGNLARYLQEIRKFPMLTAEEEYQLSKRWKEEGDEQAAHRLVTSHLRLVAKIAMGYRGYGLPVGELISEGNVGMIRRLSGSTRTAASAWPPTPCGGSVPPSRNTSCTAGRS